MEKKCERGGTGSAYKKLSAISIVAVQHAFAIHAKANQQTILRIRNSENRGSQKSSKGPSNIHQKKVKQNADCEVRF